MCILCTTWCYYLNNFLLNSFNGLILYQLHLFFSSHWIDYHPALLRMAELSDNQNVLRYWSCEEGDYLMIIFETPIMESQKVLWCWQFNLLKILVVLKTAQDLVNLRRQRMKRKQMFFRKQIKIITWNCSQIFCGFPE